MMNPRRIDGSPLNVTRTREGRVFVDCQPEFDEFGHQKHRSGPEHPNHYCRFEDYGLADGLVRCRKCGQVSLPIIKEELHIPPVELPNACAGCGGKLHRRSKDNSIWECITCDGVQP